MSGPTAMGSTPSQEAPSRTIDTRLSGRGLLVGRGVWILVTVTVVALNLIALPNVVAAQLTPEVLTALHRQGFSPTVYAVIGVGTGVVSLLVYLALSLLIFWRRSDDRMALFCAVMLVFFGGIAASPLDDATSGGPMPQPLASIPVLSATVHLLIVAGQVSFVVFFYLFPSGRFVPRWTRWFALLALVYWLADVFFPARVIGPQGSLILVFWLVAVISQVYRYRRVSTPVEREQSKWIAVGVVTAFLIVGVPSAIQLVLPTFGASPVYFSSILVDLVISNTWVVAVLLIPIVMTIAILRTHLWDIDVIINRALVYGLLTVLLAAVYFGVVIGLQTITTALTQQSKPQPVIIVASTLLIAALFNPLRSRIQSTIDHHFYRRKYDAAKTLATFGASLRSEVELTDLSKHLISVVAETMQPAQVSLWLPTATWTRRETAGEGVEKVQPYEGGGA